MDFIRHLHSGLRWVVLILLVMAIVNAYKKWKQGGSYGAKDKVLNLLTMISVHTQLLIGLILYFFNDKEGMGIKGLSHMDIPVIRFFAVEHFLGMLIAIVLITIGRKKAESGNRDKAKHRKVWLFYGIALLIIMISIPWPFITKFAGVAHYY